MVKVIDYHIHTSRCGHAEGDMEEYVESSLIRGLSEVGFSDHFPMDVLGFPEDSICSMEYSELDSYLDDIEYLREKYDDRLNIRAGIEMDYKEGMEEKIKEFTSDNRWDYVIGSVHFLDGYDFSKPGQEEFFNGKSIDDLYIKYFEEIKKLIESGIFDIVAHIDLIKKFGCRPEKLKLREIYSEISDLLLASNMTVEINTAGLRHPVKELYPSISFIQELAQKEVPITLGSDAHRPGDVAYNFNSIINGMEENVNDIKIYGFSNREPFYLMYIG